MGQGRRSITCGVEVIFAFVWGEDVDGLGNGVPQVVYGARCGRLEEGFEPGERHLDGVEVGGIGRQEAQLRAGGFSMAARAAVDLWAGRLSMITMSRGESLGQHLLPVGQKGGAVHRAVEDHRRSHAFEPERANESRGLPVPVRDGGAAAFAARRPAVATGHLGRSPGLVDEHQPLRLQIGLGLEPRPAPAQDVSALLLAGVRGFF